jgi:hypothetical protein
MAMERARRSCLSVPASSSKMLARAPGLPADEGLADRTSSMIRVHGTIVGHFQCRSAP